jgi:hypothetical protein
MAGTSPAMTIQIIGRMTTPYFANDTGEKS